MTRAETLADLIAFNAAWTRDAVAAMPHALRRWTPDDEANCIDVTFWHVARMMDVFRTRFLQGRPQDDELWFADGWAERTGYDPRGLGAHGMGGLIGYTLDEVRALPDFGLEALLGYWDAVHAAMIDHVRGLTDEELEREHQGITLRRTAYAYIRHVLMDSARHCGEILALQMMWARHHDRGMIDAAP